MGPVQPLLLGAVRDRPGGPAAVQRHLRAGALAARRARADGGQGRRLRLWRRIRGSTSAAYGAGFEFLADYRYALGADALTPLGRREMAHSGAAFYPAVRCPGAGSSRERRRRSSAPRARSASCSRPVEWTRGYHAARVVDDARDTRCCTTCSWCPRPRAPTTRSATACARRSWRARPRAWASDGRAVDGRVRGPGRGEVNAGLPGANGRSARRCTDGPVRVRDGGARRSGGRRRRQAGPPPPFCGLFTADEWRDYGCYQSVGKWYGYGPGNGLGRRRGSGGSTSWWRG